MKNALIITTFALALAVPAAAQYGGGEDETITGDVTITGDLTVEGAFSSTGVNTAPSGCATPGYAWTDDTDTGLCFAADDSQDTWSVDYMALALGGEAVVQVYSASGGEYFFEVQNPLQSGSPGAPKRMFRVRGDADLTRIYAYAPTGSSQVMDHVMTSTSHTLTYSDAPDDSDFTLSMDGVIKVGDGSAAIPSYSFNSDADAGYWYTTNNIWGGIGASAYTNFNTDGEGRFYNFFGAWTDASNYEGIQLYPAAGAIQIAPTTAGTGSDTINMTLTSVGEGSTTVVSNASGGMTISDTGATFAKSILSATEGSYDLGADASGWQALYLGDTSTGGTIIFEGTSADANEITLAAANASSDTTVTLPNVTGTALVTGTQSVTTTTFNLGGNTFSVLDGITRMANVTGEVGGEGGVLRFNQMANSSSALDGLGKTYYVDLTDNTATAMATIAVDSNGETIGGTVNITTSCTNGSNYASGTLVAAINCTTWNAGAGNPSCAVTELGEALNGDGTAAIGTMTITFTYSTDLATLNATVDCTGVTPSALTGYASFVSSNSVGQSVWNLNTDGEDDP